MSVAAQSDLRPLFHVFGILPQDDVFVQDTLNLLGIQPSLTVYNRLQEYFDLIPQDNAAFIDYAQIVYPALYTEGPISEPEYGVGWHYLKSLTYDEAEAQERTDILQSIIDLYFPNGAPTDNGTPDVCCLLDTVNVNMVNEEVIVIGGVEPYTISMDTTGNFITVTVVDFDGCESTVQYDYNSLSEEEMGEIGIYPNPAATEIYISLATVDNQVKNVQLVAMNGQVIMFSQKFNRIVDVSTIGEGLYILRIELSDGAVVSKRVLILR